MGNVRIVAIPFKSGHRFLPGGKDMKEDWKWIVAIPFKSGHRFLPDVDIDNDFALKVAIPFKSGHRFLQDEMFCQNQTSGRVAIPFKSGHRFLLMRKVTKKFRNMLTVAIPFKSGHRFLQGADDHGFGGSSPEKSQSPSNRVTDSYEVLHGST